MWKKGEEADILGHFVVRSTLSSKKTYFKCHRSGASRGKLEGERVNWRPSIKTGKNCPARIVLSKTGETFKIQYFKTHVGHDLSVKFLHLTKEERSIMAGRIQEGVPLNRILDDIRESVFEEVGIKRLHLVEKKDLHNIIREFNIDDDIAHKNDAVSTDMWVRQQESFGDDNPVILYKQHGIVDTSTSLRFHAGDYDKIAEKCFKQFYQ